jgi:bifunctional ADP-heptose synthase (sugar kinase/adenylyltransferase)
MHIQEVLNRIQHKRALVVGDICLDRWCIYDPSLAEPSRETGIPRVAVVGREVTPGLVARSQITLIAMGVAKVSVLGIQGDDGSAYELGKALIANRIDARWMVSDPHAQTFTYTKYINTLHGDEDLPRTDFCQYAVLEQNTEQRVLRNLRDAALSSDVILVSDQAETDVGGVVTAAVRDELSVLAREFPDKLIWVDSRMRPELFRGVIVKINEDESDRSLPACLWRD